MSYESEIVEALSLTAPGGGASSEILSKWGLLQDAITAWRQMHGISHQSLGGGPSVSTYEGALAAAVAMNLRAYKSALFGAGLTADPMQSRRPMGTSWDFSTRHVPA